MKKIITLLLVSLVIFSSCGLGGNSNNKKAETTTQEASEQPKDNRGYIVEVGQQAPDITISLPDENREIKLSELKGKVVMLQFTATWCGVCIKEMPFIESDIWQKLKGNDQFALYGIMYKQGVEDVKKMRELTSVTYPLAIDPAGEFFHSFAEMGAGVTRNVIIDRDGKIAYLTRLFNEEEFSSMVSKINELVNQSNK